VRRGRVVLGAMLVAVAFGAWLLAPSSSPPPRSSMGATMRWLQFGAPGPAYQLRLSADLHRFDTDVARSSLAFDEHPSATRLAHAVVGALVDCAATQSTLESHPPSDPPSQPLRREWIAWRGSVAQLDTACANLSADPSLLGTRLTSLSDAAGHDARVLQGTWDSIVGRFSIAD
jgi:hypothetical protein